MCWSVIHNEPEHVLTFYEVNVFTRLAALQEHTAAAPHSGKLTCEIPPWKRARLDIEPSGSGGCYEARHVGAI
jgi:hypothetical protein